MENELTQLDCRINEALNNTTNAALRQYAENLVTKALAETTFSIKEILNVLTVFVNAVQMGGDCGRLQLFQYLSTQFKVNDYNTNQQRFILEALQRYFQPGENVAPCGSYDVVTEYLQNMPSVRVRTKQLRENFKTMLFTQLNELPALINELEPKDKANFILRMAAIVMPKSETVDTSNEYQDSEKENAWNI